MVLLPHSPVDPLALPREVLTLLARVVMGMDEHIRPPKVPGGLVLGWRFGLRSVGGLSGI